MIILNGFTKSCNWYNYVTWRGKEYEVTEDDTIVSKHVRAWQFINYLELCVCLFYKLIKMHGKRIKIISNYTFQAFYVCHIIYIYIYKLVNFGISKLKSSLKYVTSLLHYCNLIQWWFINFIRTRSLIRTEYNVVLTD